MVRIDCISPDGEILQTIEMPDGITINDAAKALSDTKLPCPVIALAGGTPAVKKYGDWDLPLKGTNLQFRQIAMGGGGGGGGKNPMQTVFQIAIIALAIAATSFLGGAGGYLVASGWSLGAANFAAGLLGAGIMMLGTMLMGVLFPAKSPNVPAGQIGQLDAAQASPTYSLNASGNQARLYQPEPEGFGWMKIVPDFVANTWMQFIANEQVGYFVYGIGRGSYQIESLQFGETVFWKNGHFAGDSGFVDDTGPVYSDNPKLLLPEDGSFSEAARITGSQQTRSCTLTFSFPKGLGVRNWIPEVHEQYYDQETNTWNYRYEPGRWEVKGNAVSIEVRARKTDNSGCPISEWQDAGKFSYSAATASAFTKQAAITLEDFAIWEISARVIKNRADGTNVLQTAMLDSFQSKGASVSIEFVEPGEAVSIFPDNVVTSDEVSGQELFGPNSQSYTGALGPFVANPAGTQTDRILLDFVFQQGVGHYNNGGLERITVKWIVEYQKIDDLGNPLEEWAVLENCSFSGATVTPQRLTKTYAVTKARYQIRCRRITNSYGDGRSMDSLVWTAMRAMLPGTLSYPVSCIAIAIKASNTLSQSASRQFSVIATRKLPLYDRKTKTWSEVLPILWTVFSGF